MGEPICCVRMGGEREDGRAHMLCPYGRGERRWESTYALSIWEGRGKMGEPICCVHMGGEREDGRAHMLCPFGRGEGRWESPYAVSIWEGRGKMGEPICCITIGDMTSGMFFSLHLIWTISWTCPFQFYFNIANSRF